MANPFAIRHQRLQSGERFVYLADATTGVPLPAPTLYVLKRLRTRHLAVNSVEAHLRAIMLLLVVLKHRAIDLPNRIHTGKLLSHAEIEYIASKCKLPLLSVLKECTTKIEKVNAHKVFNADFLLSKPKADSRPIASSHRDRITYIRDYIDDLVAQALGQIDNDTDFFLRLEATRQNVNQSFTSLIPRRRKSKTRKSLTLHQLDVLWDTTDPHSAANPFSTYFTRYRNDLIVQWFVLLGLRRDELRGIRLADICWTTKSVKVERRQDSISDPRAKEARAKTIDGVVPIGDELLSYTHKFLTDPRLRPAFAIGGNEFLFTANTGEPISASAIENIFKRIRTSAPELPSDLCSQICRHTTNDILSRGFDRQGVSATDEAIRRRHLMRWSLKSEMPDHYNQRRIEEKAREASLQVQTEHFVKRGKNATR